jgi:hypothetical protein
MRSMASDVEAVLKEFFELTTAGWIHARCELEISEMQERQSIAKAKANKRWDMQRTAHSNATASEKNATAYAAASKSDADAMLPTPTPTPTPNKKNTATAVATPAGVSQSVWTDFCQQRKAKGAKLTQTAMDGIQREADKAGWTLEDALREVCSRGWAGFKAEWVSDKRTVPKAHEPAWRTEQRNRTLAAVPAIADTGISPTEFFDVEAKNVTAFSLGR